MIKTKTKMKKWFKVIAVFLLMIVVLPGLIYLGLAIYYQESFMYGTWINGIYCTGKTITEAAEELEQSFSYEELKVFTPYQEEVLPIEELEPSFDFVSALEEYRKRQNPYEWYLNLLKGKEKKEFFPKISFSQHRLEEWIKSTRGYQENLKLKPDKLVICWTDQGYVLKEEKALILNTQEAEQIIKEAIIQGKQEVVLEEESCYFYRDETLEMQKMRELFEKIEQHQSFRLTYVLKEEEKKLQPKDLGAWLLTDSYQIPQLDQQGKLMIEKEKIAEFVQQMAKEYDTWGNYKFTTHNGKEISISKGNYGTQINQKKEIAFLTEWLKNPVETVRTPVYLKDVTYKDKNKIDETYIEIDMNLQKMFYFSQGEKVLETDVVTGWTKRGMGTPEMVCFIQRKSRNAVLKGPGYRSFVNYWMPVYGGIGIHDASWRDEFGGQIYMKSGSHGCINTPLERMADLFEMVEVGTPVVIHGNGNS